MEESEEDQKNSESDDVNDILVEDATAKKENIETSAIFEDDDLSASNMGYHGMDGFDEADSDDWIISYYVNLDDISCLVISVQSQGYLLVFALQVKLSKALIDKYLVVQYDPMLACIKRASPILCLQPHLLTSEKKGSPMIQWLFSVSGSAPLFFK